MLNHKELIFTILKFFRRPLISEKLSFSEPINIYLKERFSEFDSYLEYGSGSSTIFFSKNYKAEIISVESDFVFAKAVRKHIKNINVKVLNANIGLTGYWGYPLFFKNSFSKGWKYVNTPWRNLGNNYFPDVILIDGRYRVACALNILLKAVNKRKILIIIDDYNGREQYKIIEQFLKKTNSIDRMAFFEYDTSLINDDLIKIMKSTLKQYLTKPE